MPSFTYQFTPSSTNSSPDKSRFSLECNFDQLACEYPEFKCEFDRLNKRRRREESSADNDLTRAAAKARTQANQSDNETIHDSQDSRSESKSTNSFSSEINHSFNVALTRALLQKHFGLNMPSLPEGRLCPPVPNRCNYVAWLKQLMLRNSMDLYRFSKAEGLSSYNLQYKGIDIGTGVSAIYPLLLSTELFAKCNELNRGQPNKWKFLATDIDYIAIESARQNVNANNLQDEICVALVTKEESTTSSRGNMAKGPLFSAMKVAKEEDMFKQIDTATNQENEHDDDNYPKFDFCMTNPPFYESVDEVTAPRAGDKRSRTDMSINEGLYRPADASSQGGDVGFVESIIQDSIFLRTRVTWYTSLIAKRSSLDAIYQNLQSVEGIWGNRGQIRTVEFRQDNADSEEKKKDHFSRVRWGIAWTFERAVGRVTSCRLRGGLQSFVVSIPIRGDATDAINEVSSRLQTYYSEVRDLNLKCTDEYRERNNDVTSNERTKERCVTVTEERFSGHTGAPTSHHDQDNRNLPIEGHFIIDAFISTKSISQSCSDNVDVEVSLEVYAHTKYGTALVNKIRSQLTGEIGRTNRRWRRLLKRQLASFSMSTTSKKP